MMVQQPDRDVERRGLSTCTRLHFENVLDPAYSEKSTAANHSPFKQTGQKQWVSYTPDLYSNRASKVGPENPRPPPRRP
eukprot:1157855-Pelagomonas_calceolata.AAC.2